MTSIAWIMDPSGHVWTIATRIEETTEQERRDRWSSFLVRMRGERARVLLVAVGALCCAAVASAEDRAGATYALGGVALMHQAGPTGESSETYVTAPGGSTLGWSVGGGVFVARAVSAELELSSTGWMSAREPSRYGMTFNEERRDRIISLAARFYLPRLAAFRVEPVIGIAITRPEAWSQTDRYLYWLTPQQQLVKEPRLQHHLDTAVGLTFGCDVRVGRRRAALLPSFRVSDTGVSHGHYSESSDRREIAAIYPGGYPRWTVRSGVAVRVDF